MEIDSPSKMFTGVHFVLFGFNLVDEREVLSKLVNGGGVDVRQYSQSCTHVIVDTLAYDDPVCVAARHDGKTLVTGLWVHHSFDIGLPMEATSIMYRPLRDSNGIPRAKSLIMCLTGYQRQDRDDVMTMVSLMGAQFSKPLVANKVTHLICYKFEGEKYELAKKLKTIKLVNHRWLEDCLRDWELIPEASYSMSGYDLEMIETEAKDSEEEIDKSTMKHFGRRNAKSPNSMKFGLPLASEFSKSVAEVPNIFPVPASSKGSTDVDVAKCSLLIPGDENELVQPRKSDNTIVSNALGREDTVFFQHDISSKLPNKHLRTQDSVKGRNELTSISLNAARLPHSDEQISSRSNSMRTPRKSTLPLHSGETLNNVINSSKVPLAEVKDYHDFDVSLFKLEQTKDRTDSGFVETSGKGLDFVYVEELNDKLPQKRMSDISYGSSKSQKMSHDEELCFVRTPASEITHFSLSNDNGPYMDENVDLALAHISCNSTLITKSTSAIEKPLTSATKNSSNNTLATKSADATEEPLTSNLPFSKTVTSESEQYGISSKIKKTPKKCFRRVKGSNETPAASNLPFSKNVRSEIEQDYSANKTKNTKKCPQRLKESTLDRKTDNSGTGISENVVGKTEEPQNYCPEAKGTSQIDQNAEGKKLDYPADSVVHKTHRKKMIAKKSLGSRPKLGSTYQKGSVLFRKGMSENDDAKFCVGENQKHVESPQTVNIEVSEVTGTGDVTKTAVKDQHEIECMDEETEAPENEELDPERVLNEEKSEVVQLKNKADKILEETSAGMQLESNSSKASVLDEFVSEKAVRETEREGPVFGRSIELDEPNVRGDEAKGQTNNEKKRSKGKIKKWTSHSVTKSNHGQGSEVTENENTRETEKGKSPSLTAGSKTSSTPGNLEKVTVVEKENMPLVDGDQNIDRPTVKSNAKTMKIGQNDANVGLKSSMPAEEVLGEVKNNPSWFILSGHRLQRKEFQQVIRQLKGRFCRDSHQWSYQATHFIAPAPIRRTEKLFAAAASGRWVLKTDYLTASSQAGRLLAEEPYEWYTKGLSEDGAINLEAPRKWRLLRERTGHGAFYGMRIIIYGECIAPPLDTLKRVIKAGDGMILATSPPYTRFLNTSVDFAIISPGMPHVDIWVQAFLSNEIPCVIADYLVEYVCKPGYPLEKHVLYNTHAWAEKSFGNLQKRAVEIVEDPATSNDCDNDDIACRVCGSRERGEVMLICGDEKGSTGCGMGMHIDCCDPPLVDIPEDDWFCPECTTSRNSMDSSNKFKRGPSSLKMK